MGELRREIVNQNPRCPHCNSKGTFDKDEDGYIYCFNCTRRITTNILGDLVIQEPVIASGRKRREVKWKA